MFPNTYTSAFKIKTEENDGTLKTSQLSTLEYLKKRQMILSKGEGSVTRDQSNSSLITNVIVTQDSMPISLTIDNSSSEIVNLIEFSTPRKTPSNQFNYEKTDEISSFNFKDSKIQSSTHSNMHQT